jgi:hypothetical protein
MAEGCRLTGQGLNPKRPFKVAGANVGYWIAKRPSDRRDQLAANA